MMQAASAAAVVACRCAKGLCVEVLSGYYGSGDGSFVTGSLKNTLNAAIRCTEVRTLSIAPFSMIWGVRDGPACHDLFSDERLTA